MSYVCRRLRAWVVAVERPVVGVFVLRKDEGGGNHWAKVNLCGSPAFGESNVFSFFFHHRSDTSAVSFSFFFPVSRTYAGLRRYNIGAEMLNGLYLALSAGSPDVPVSHRLWSR